MSDLKQEAPQGKESLTWRVVCQVDKYANEEAFKLGKVLESLRSENNLLLNEGVQLLEDLLIGAGGTAYNNANARIGVGNGNAAALATQTGLQGGSTAFKAMDATFPSRSSQTVSWRATFTGTEGNFAWEEWTIVNAASDAGTNLNRKVESFGTKVSGAVWQITVQITIS